MRVRADSSKPASVQADVLAVPIYLEDREPPPDLTELDEATGGAITRTLFVALAMIESLAIYCLVIALIVLFANPFAGSVPK
jgi:hypothetical protein